MKMSVSISGLAELDRALGQLPKATARNVMRRTLLKAGEPIANEAKRLAPVDQGDLRDSIMVLPRLKNKVGSAEYAAAMRAGLGKQAAVAALRGARRAANSGGFSAQMFVGPATGKGVIRYAHMIEFGTVKMAPQPFMRPAWDATQRVALDIIKRELGSQIIMAARRVGRSKKQSVEVKARASIAALLAHEAGY